MTITELQETQEFQKLAPRWQAFLLEYLKDGDSSRAAHVVYPKHGNAGVCGASLLRRYQIQAALDRYFGRPALDRVLADLWTVIRQCQRAKSKLSKEQASALKIGIQFYDRLSGRATSPRSIPVVSQEQHSNEQSKT
jgi:hypothetical protein